MMIAQAWLDELKIHDVADYYCPIALNSTNLGSGPEPRVSTSGRPSADGSINRSRYYNARMIELAGMVSDVSPYASARTLSMLRAALTLRRPHVLRFTPLGAANEFQAAVVAASGLDAPTSGWAPKLRWGITLEAPDPRYFSTLLNSEHYSPGALPAYGPGLALPLDFPLVLTHTGGGGDATMHVTNTGTWETPVELTVRGPSTSLTAIVNHTTGEAVTLDAIALDNGDVLVIDTAARTITLDVGGHGTPVPAPDLIDAAHNVWMELAVGDNELELVGDGFVFGQTQLTARWRAAMF